MERRFLTETPYLRPIAMTVGRQVARRPRRTSPARRPGGCGCVGLAATAPPGRPVPWEPDRRVPSPGLRSDNMTRGKLSCARVGLPWIDGFDASLGKVLGVACGEAGAMVAADRCDLSVGHAYGQSVPFSMYDDVRV